MNIILAGGAGFIGSHLVPVLLGAGHQVTAILRPDSSVPQGWDQVEVLKCDLTLLASVKLPKADAIVHLAQSAGAFPENANALHAVNCVSAIQLAAHALDCGAQKMIYASSGTVYGFTDHPVSEDAPLLGGGYYAQTKIAAERLLSEFRKRLDVDMLRIFSPYGPGQQPFRLIPDVVSRVLQGRPVSVRESGLPFLSPIHISDVVKCIVSRLSESNSLTFNVAGSELLGIREIAACVGLIAGVKPCFEENKSECNGGMAGLNHVMQSVTGISPVSLREGLQSIVSKY